jgi:general secretion pathway protein G
MKTHKRSKALSFLVIGIIVVAGILTCPPSAKRLQPGKPQIAKIQIKELEGALQLFYLDTGRYPTTVEGLDALMQNPGLTSWQGPYLTKRGVPRDPWGRVYVYRCPAQHGAYDLLSFGADGIEGGEEDVTSWESAPGGR